LAASAPLEEVLYYVLMTGISSIYGFGTCNTRTYDFQLLGCPLGYEEFNDGKLTDTGCL
jgi:hypothetical protein